MSNNSDSRLFEGARSHVIIYDEPPRRDVRVACARGLIDCNGIEIFAATLLSEAWIDKEVINGLDKDGNIDTSVWSVIGDIQDNVGHGITQEGVDQYSKALTEDEKQARLRGVPAYKAGLILAIDRETHVLERTVYDVQSHWIVDISIDYHPSKPQYVMFLATDESNKKYVCHELIFHGDGHTIADKIVKSIKRYDFRVNEIIADPLSNMGQTNIVETEFDKIADGLARFGYGVRAAGDLKQLKEDGILKINHMLHTPNGITQLYFFKSCAITIKQCVGWMYDPKVNDKAMPQKSNDDMPENLYRLCLLDTKYTDPREEEEEPIYRGRKTSSRVTGY